MTLRSFSLFLTIVFFIAAPSVATEEATHAEKLFALRLKRLFAEKCNACHGDNVDEIEGGLNMLSREGLLVGGDSWGKDVLKPGAGLDSFLYIATTRKEEGYEMPPKEAEQLTREEMSWLREWIDAGAPWPSEEVVAKIQQQYAEGEVVPTSGGLSDDWTGRRYETKHLWAYRPLQVEEVPDGKHPVDWFVNRKLAASNLEAAPAATPEVVYRRLAFGLTGLPPSQQQMADFTRAFSVAPETTVAHFASSLMSQPQYGEHFGRLWLDVARYADSAGFANDYSRPNAWRYRDYVIRAFNDDKPYDQFVRQQIAGDEMPAPAKSESEAKLENIIATGFLRMGPWEQTGMSVFRVTRQQWLDDVTDSVGQTFLAHPLQCCKCHDHKFDPVPTRDYYSMMAFFTTTQFNEPNLPFMKVENKTGFVAADAWSKAKVDAYQKQKQSLNDRVNKARKKETGDAKVGDNGLDPGDEASLARMNKNIARHNWERDRTRPIAFSVYTGNTIERKSVQSRLIAMKNPWSKGSMEPDTILNGGDAFSRGDVVKPAALSAAKNLSAMPDVKFPDGKGKRRSALADWITHDQNPLAPRVIVNRVWSWHFGIGIAGNPNNFGATGALPTHPALLDYLADWFVKNGWSIKKLNRLIVTSQAYRRASQHPSPDQYAKLDPKQESYAAFRPRRLTAEELRDAMLFVSGELNQQVGGLPCRPDINFEVAMQPRQIMGGTASVYEPDPKPSQRNRRTIYAEKLRGLRDPFLETFNQPGPDKSCELRETSIVAPQALTLLNASEMQDRALAFADRLMKQYAGDESKKEAAIIRRAFSLALGRPATQDEVALCVDHWQASEKVEAQKTYVSQKFESSVQRTVMAEKTGEPYDFIEHMPAYESYVPDLQPSQVDAKTRALAHVCLVLFNSNEFAYLD